MLKKRIILISSGVVVLTAIVAMVLWNGGHGNKISPFSFFNKAENVNKSMSKVSKIQKTYDSGDILTAEKQALSFIKESANSKHQDAKFKRKIVEARKITAYSAARRKDLKTASERFAVMENEAHKLPDKGAVPIQPGYQPPSLEEDAAYQHAVCTAALGDKKAAEAEYIKFMKDYPESALIHGSLTRIGMLHNDKIPKYAEDVWNQAKKVAADREKERQKAASMCGPLCLAELFKRNGKTVSVDDLAKEMKTDETGTSMKSMADAAKKRGIRLNGLKLTQTGFLEQDVPLIALIAPGHYVIVEEISKRNIKIWDPYGAGLNKPKEQTYTTEQWKQIWQGVVLKPGIRG